MTLLTSLSSSLFCSNRCQKLVTYKEINLFLTDLEDYENQSCSINHCRQHSMSGEKLGERTAVNLFSKQNF